MAGVWTPWTPPGSATGLRLRCLLCWQHNMAMLSGMVIIPLFVAKTVCLDWVTTSQVFSTALFICGLTTLMQAVVGSRYMHTACEVRRN